MSRPLILGLTGSIGMGKSTVAQMFRDEGVPVFDADAEVHRLQGPGGRLVAEIEIAFPGSTGPEGVNRAELGARVFGDRDKLAKLEQIIHPVVAEMRQTFMIEHAGAQMVVFDIPLLFEKGGAEQVDAVVVVSAPAEEQRRRVLARDGMTEEKFAEILSLQVPDAEKCVRADHVIDTGTTLGETRAAVHQLIQQLSQEKGDS